MRVWRKLSHTDKGEWSRGEVHRANAASIPSDIPFPGSNAHWSSAVFLSLDSMRHTCFQGWYSKYLKAYSMGTKESEQMPEINNQFSHSYASHLNDSRVWVTLPFCLNQQFTCWTKRIFVDIETLFWPNSCPNHSLCNEELRLLCFLLLLLLLTLLLMTLLQGGDDNGEGSWWRTSWRWVNWNYCFVWFVFSFINAAPKRINL